MTIIDGKLLEENLRHKIANEVRQFSRPPGLAVILVGDDSSSQGYGRNNPYCSGVVTLTEGPRISARLSKVDASNPETIKSGMSLKIDFDNIDTNSPILTFCPG